MTTAKKSTRNPPAKPKKQTGEQPPEENNPPIYGDVITVFDGWHPGRLRPTFDVEAMIRESYPKTSA